MAAKKKIPPVPVPAGHKYCFKCSTLKPIDAFAIARAQSDGRRSVSRRCHVARVTDWQRRHKQLAA